MPKNLSEKEHTGTLKLKIIYGKLAANGALGIIDNSRLCSLITLESLLGKLKDTRVPPIPTIDTPRKMILKS